MAGPIKTPTAAALEVANRFRLTALAFRAIGAFALADAYETLVERELAAEVSEPRDEKNGRRNS